MVFSIFWFFDKSTFKYEIVLNFNDWVSNFEDKSAQYCKIGSNVSKLFEFLSLLQNPTKLRERSDQLK